MRFAFVCLALGVAVFGCAAPSKPAPAAAPVVEQDVQPTPEQFASWAVSHDDALRIACEQIGADPISHFILTATALVRGTEAFWHVDATNIIAGSWRADVDAFTGRVLRSRYLPGR